jgi:hypothetical protein
MISMDKNLLVKVVVELIVASSSQKQGESYNLIKRTAAYQIDTDGTSLSFNVLEGYLKVPLEYY